ncbi:hypothetical protein FGA82_22185 [Pseudomonas fluorescens]|nr:hypothetical protein FGA82_22185 [Pseudomonas fluorescens]
MKNTDSHGATQTKPADKYDSRVIVKLESDSVTDQAAQHIYDKHPDNSVLLQRDAQGQHTMVAGDLQSIGGQTKVKLVGHGDGTPGGSRTLGGLDAEGLAHEVGKLRNDAGATDTPSIKKVNLVGCGTGVCDSGPSLANAVGEALHQQAIDAPTKGYDGRIDLTADGHIHSVDEGGLMKPGEGAQEEKNNGRHGFDVEDTYANAAQLNEAARANKRAPEVPIKNAKLYDSIPDGQVEDASSMLLRPKPNKGEPDNMGDHRHGLDVNETYNNAVKLKEASHKKWIAAEQGLETKVNHLMEELGLNDYTDDLEEHPTLSPLRAAAKEAKNEATAREETAKAWKRVLTPATVKSLLNEVPYISDREAFNKRLQEVPIKNAELYDRIPDGRITAKIMNDYNVGEDFVAVRVQGDEFIDFQTNTIQGHQKPHATILNGYDPVNGRSRHELAATMAQKTGQDALNVMLVPKGSEREVIAGGKYAEPGKSWLSFPFVEALKLGGRLYPDMSSSVRPTGGAPFLITLPKGTRLPVDIISSVGGNSKTGDTPNILLRSQPNKGQPDNRDRRHGYIE